jgi:hypothetical protein
MAYRRTDEFMWISDGAAPWGKYVADDGTYHDSAQKAIEHNKRERAARAALAGEPREVIDSPATRHNDETT